MSDIVRFETADGPVLAEVDDQGLGIERIARDDRGIVEAGQRLDDSLAALRPAINAIIKTLRELAPDQHEIEFGIKLTAEAGVVVAKTAVEGHFNVKLSWQRSADDVTERA
ncbi:MAG TPA: CU044_2847 family protein [Pseudonocardiaceae bacterium]|jgi:hypothetical protein